MKGAEREIIHWGKCLFERRLISGWGGNISCRAGKGRFLITAQHAALGFLAAGDLVEIDAEARPVNKKRRPSSETPLHLAVYHGTDAKAVIHAHPPGVLAFSLGHKRFVPLSFEEKYTIGEVPVLAQETPTVVETEPVAKALRLRPVVILQGHGTVAVGKNLQEAFLLTDLLEEAVRCQFLKGDASVSGPERESETVGSRASASFPLFSHQHMSALVDRANADAEFQRLGRETALTTSLTMASEDDGASWTFHFEDGRIEDLQAGGEGDFMFAGKREWWEAIFQGRMDPFLATQQGRLKLTRGELWRLSRWFKAFQRGFTLWQAIPIA